MGTLIITWTSCSRKDRIPVFDPAFEAYIESFTTGTVASEAFISIRFTFPVDTAVQKQLKATDLLRSRPKVRGNLSWPDAYTLVLKPEKPLKEGRIYLFELCMDRLIKVPKELRRFRFGIQVMEQGFQLSQWMLHALERQGNTIYYVKGEVRSANPAEFKELEARLGLKVGGKELKLHWEAANGGRDFNFTSDTFNRPPHLSRIELITRGDNFFIPAELGKEILFNEKEPGILQWRMFFGEENYLWLAFSEPLDPQQNLNGLVLLDGITPRRFQIRENQLFCYFDSDFTGGSRIEIFPGIKDVRGRQASHRQSMEIEGIFPKPALKWLQSGNILPSSGNVNLPFAAVGLKAVDVKVIRILEQNVKNFLQDNEISSGYDMRRVGKVVARTTLDLTKNKTAVPFQWETYFLNLTELIKTEPGAIYRITLGMKPEYSAYPCSNTHFTNLPESAEEGDYWGSGDDYVDYYFPKGYRWSESENPCHISYYTSDRWISTQLLVTNIGLTAKTGNDGKLWVWAADILSGQPLKGTDLKVYDYQLVLLGEARTDAEGLATLSVKGDPFLVVASKGKEKSYLKISQGNELSVSAFDVDGETVPQGIKGFIYGERGVWRPGDTLHLWFMLDNRLKKLPEEYPVIMELRNPFGQLVTKEVSTKQTGGIHAFRLVTSPQAPTGKWTVQVKAGQSVFTKTVNIETIEPNRLKVNLITSGQLETHEDNKFQLHAAWLHGAPAPGLKARVEISLKEGQFAPEGFRGFNFYDESQPFTGDSRVIFSGNLDAGGNASFNYRPEVYRAPGMLTAVLTTKVFEPGGAFSIDQTEIPLHTYNRYVGFRLPDPLPDWGNYSNEKPLEMDLALVDIRGQPVAAEATLQLSLYRLEWRWWISRGNTRSAIVENELADPEVKVEVILKNGKAHYALPVKGLTGRFLLRVSDPFTGHQSSRIVYIGYVWGESSTEARGMVFLRPVKRKVNSGEEASVVIPSVPGANILVCIEARGSVLDYQWVESKGNETVFSFKTTPEMTPGVYVYASVIQPWQHLTNDLPIRLYGLTYLEIEYPQARLEPLIDIASKLKASQKATLRISEKTGRPMAYTLAIVDEGLLDLTRFSTPDPYKAFLAKEAQTVKTWDLYSLIAGSFSSRMDRVFMVGGDEYRRPHDNLLARRFKPLVITMGPFSLKKGETRRHVINIPEYIGSARVMVVAAGQGAYGSGEKTVKITKPLMVLGGIPRVLGPAEEVWVAATVWKTENQVKDATVNVDTKGDLQLVGSGAQKIVFDHGQQEKTVWFKIKTGKRTGVCSIRFTARWQNETSVWESDIDLRNPNPVITETQNYLVEPGKRLHFNLANVNVPDDETLMEVSSFPAFSLNRRALELIQYPYGCAEQTVSALFPQLLLKGFASLDPLQAEKRNNYIRTGIQKLTGMQVAGGGIGFWPGMNSPDEWVTSWVGHFMLEAQKHGYAVPSTFFDAWMNYQRKLASQWRYTSNSSSSTVQAYRLLTLALAGKPEFGAMNRLRNSEQLTSEAGLFLAHAYAISGNKEIARELLGQITNLDQHTETPGISLSSALRMQAVKLFVKVQVSGEEKENFVLARDISEVLRSERKLCTQEIAWSLLALHAYLDGRKTGYLPEFSFSIDGKSRQIKSDFPVWTYTFTEKVGKTSVFNSSKAPLYVNLVRTFRPQPGEKVEASSNGLTLSVKYFSSDNKPFHPQKILQGSDFSIQVVVTNISGKPMEHGALNLILPSGWQVLNTRFNNEEDESQVRNFTWQDIRDDRVYTYFRLSVGETKTFNMKVNASFRGRFFMPAVLVEDMYNPSIQALNPGFFTEVYVP